MEKYREFDTESSSGASETTFIKGLRFTRRELVLGIATLVCILVIIILAALLGSANRRGSDDHHASAQVSQNGSGSGSGSTASCSKENSCYTPTCLQAASHVLELVSKTAADPCDDFYTFACSNFPRLHPLEPDEYEVTTFSLLYRQNQDRLRRMVEKVPYTDDPEHYESKVKYFYTSCMDHFQRTGLKGTPLLENVIDPSGGWWVLTGDQGLDSSSYSFQTQLEKVHVDFWTDAFFTFSVAPDFLDWNKATIEIYLGGLGLYSGYYERADLVAGYAQYMRTVASMLLRDSKLNLTDQDKNDRLDTFVNDVIFVESELATLIVGSKEEEDPYARNRRPTLGDLNRNSTGDVDWVHLFSYMFKSDTTHLVNANTRVVVFHQEYIQKFSKWMKDLNPANKTRLLNNYMMWRLASHYSRYLDWDYANAYFKFQKNQTGSAEPLPSWLFCLRLIDYSMPDAMGALYVQDHFSDVNKKHAHEITDYVKKALTDSLSSKLHWMSPETRDIAIQKLNNSLIKLGYPDYMLHDDTLNGMYSSVTIHHKEYVNNIVSLFGAVRQHWIDYLKHPNDTSVWVYPTYSTYLEYYSPWQELIVPAGILQFPIFDYKSPRYMNFGSMGSIVGRELTHAVDEIGNQYLLNGSHYGEWWSAETTKKYWQVRNCTMEAYYQYPVGPIESYEVYGQVNVSLQYIPQALSESSGVKLAYNGYQQWMKKNGKEPMMPGCTYTNDQMFFISYAQSYCTNHDPWDEFFYVFVHNHITEKVRINGALAQLPEFQKTFQCPQNSNMVARKRCNLF